MPGRFVGLLLVAVLLSPVAAAGDSPHAIDGGTAARVAADLYTWGYAIAPLPPIFDADAIDAIHTEPLQDNAGTVLAPEQRILSLTGQLEIMPGGRRKPVPVSRALEYSLLELGDWGSRMVNAGVDALGWGDNSQLYLRPAWHGHVMTRPGPLPGGGEHVDGNVWIRLAATLRVVGAAQGELDKYTTQMVDPRTGRWRAVPWGHALWFAGGQFGKAFGGEGILHRGTPVPAGGRRFFASIDMVPNRGLGGKAFHPARYARADARLKTLRIRHVRRRAARR